MLLGVTHVNLLHSNVTCLIQFLYRMMLNAFLAKNSSMAKLCINSNKAVVFEQWFLCILISEVMTLSCTASHKHS